MPTLDRRRALVGPCVSPIGDECSLAVAGRGTSTVVAVTLHSPPSSVLRAFGARPPAHLLVGGQGTSWRAGDLVLKPLEGASHGWTGETLERLTPLDLRLARPVRSTTGEWTVKGWAASRFAIGGSADLSQPKASVSVVEAGRALHRLLGRVPCPPFLVRRRDVWAVADRVAWGEQEAIFRPELHEVAQRLLAQPSPGGAPQIVHGDLSGNVLLAPGLPPAVIDFSWYWRPTAYAEGIVVADALCWHGADESTIALVDVPTEAVARGLLFRVATTNLMARDGGDIHIKREARAFARAASMLGM